MILKLNGPLRIDNLRRHPAEMVARLCSLLAAGAVATPDPHRNGFYDLEDGKRIFYVHLSPTGTVLLLATWLEEGAPAAALRKAPLAERVACCA